MSAEEMGEPEPQNSEHVKAQDEEVARLIAKTMKRAKHIYLSNTLVIISLLLTIMTLFFYAYIGLPNPKKGLWCLASALLFTANFAYSLSLAQTFFREGKQEMMRIDKRGINTLCQLVVHSSGTRLYKIALARFLEVLQTMNASDAPRISGATRLLINKILDQGNTETVLPLLVALEQVGDKWCVSHIKKLKFAPFAILHRKRREEVKAQAQRTLDFIEQRLEEGKNAITLLRPSSPSDAPETLLRPATETPNESAEVLLKPSHKELVE